MNIKDMNYIQKLQIIQYQARKIHFQYLNLTITDIQAKGKIILDIVNNLLEMECE